jgi:hypothetical protein
MKTAMTMMWAVLGLAAMAVLYRSSRLAAGYNVWTTRFRERHPGLNSPPSDVRRAMNTRIMTWQFRLFGCILLIVSAIALIGLLSSD